MLWAYRKRRRSIPDGTGATGHARPRPKPVNRRGFVLRVRVCERGAFGNTAEQPGTSWSIRPWLHAPSCSSAGLAGLGSFYRIGETVVTDPTHARHTLHFEPADAGATSLGGDHRFVNYNITTFHLRSP